MIVSIACEVEISSHRTACNHFQRACIQDSSGGNVTQRHNQREGSPGAHSGNELERREHGVSSDRTSV